MVSRVALVRPALERLRDVVSQVHIGVLLCHAPDRLARRYAYQVLLLEEFARAGTEVRCLKATPPDTPEAALLVQVQGIIAEYEKAQILERTLRGKLHRAKTGSVNVLSGAPFGYRYVRKGPDTPARYEIVEHEARIVRELFRRYTEEPLSLRALGKWLTEQGIPTAAGRTLCDHVFLRGTSRVKSCAVTWLAYSNAVIVIRAPNNRLDTHLDLRSQSSFGSDSTRPNHRGVFILS